MQRLAEELGKFAFSFERDTSVSRFYGQMPGFKKLVDLFFLELA